MPENNKENCDKLANIIVNKWTREDLVKYGAEMLTVELQLNKEEFDRAWSAEGVDNEQ